MKRSPGTASRPSRLARSTASAAPLNAEIEIQSGPQPGGVREQVTQAHAILPVPPELRDEPGSRIVEAQTAFLEQHHHGRSRGDDLRQRGQIEDRVGRHTFDHGEDRAAAKRVLVDQAGLPAHHDNGAGKLMVTNGGVHDVRNPPKGFGGDRRGRALRARAVNEHAWLIQGDQHEQQTEGTHGNGRAGRAS